MPGETLEIQQPFQKTLRKMEINGLTCGALFSSAGLCSEGPRCKLGPASQRSSLAVWRAEVGGEPSPALLVASGVTDEDGSGRRVLPISHSAGAESPLWAVVAAVGSQFLFLAPRFALRGRGPRGSCGGSFPGRSVLQCPSSQPFQSFQPSTSTSFLHSILPVGNS